MNRLIQKTTSVILSLATVVLIGAPAFAAYEPQETASETCTVEETAAEKGGSELDGVSEDEIIRSFSIDEADNEPEETEDSGEEITDEESIKENAMLPFIELAEKAENSFSDLIYVIGAPILMFVPIFGMAAIIDGFASLFSILALPLSFIGACIEACEIYFATNGSK